MPFQPPRPQTNYPGFWSILGEVPRNATGPIGEASPLIKSSSKSWKVDDETQLNHSTDVYSPRTPRATKGFFIGPAKNERKPMGGLPFGQGRLTSPCPNSVEAMIGICLTQEKHRCFQLLKDVEGTTCFPYFDGVDTTNYRFNFRLLEVGHRWNSNLKDMFGVSIANSILFGDLFWLMSFQPVGSSLLHYLKTFGWRRSPIRIRRD